MKQTKILFQSHGLAVEEMSGFEIKLLPRSSSFIWSSSNSYNTQLTVDVVKNILPSLSHSIFYPHEVQSD